MSCPAFILIPGTRTTWTLDIGYFLILQPDLSTYRIQSFHQIEGEIQRYNVAFEQAIFQALHHVGGFVMVSASGVRNLQIFKCVGSSVVARERQLLGVVPARMQRQRAFRARLCRMGFVAPSKEDSEKIARMIAGEEP